jgi:hypothetical protein
MRTLVVSLMACASAFAQYSYKPASTGLPPLPSGVTIPTLPQSYPDIGYPYTRGITHIVTSGSALTALLSGTSLKCGDKIVLSAGITYTPAYNGAFTFPDLPCGAAFKASDGNYHKEKVLITTSSSTCPAQGTRVGRSNLSSLYTFRATGGVPVIQFANGANYYYFECGEITDDGSVLNSSAFSLVTTPYVDSYTEFAREIVFDRMYIHGNEGSDYPATGTMLNKGIFCNALGCALINSRCFSVFNIVQDTSCFYADDGGPYLVQNSYLSASGENIMFGGSGPATPGGYVKDATIVRNEFTKDTAWQHYPSGCVAGGSPVCVDVKDEFEIKHAVRVLVDSNVFMKTWPAAQDEFIIMNCPSPTVEPCTDFTVTNNLFLHGPAVIDIAGVIGANGVRVLVRNNLAEDIGTNIAGNTLGSTWGMGTIEDSTNLTIDHNSFLGTSNGQGPYANTSLFLGNDAPTTNSYGYINNNLFYGQLEANGSNPGEAYDSFTSISTNTMSNNAWVGDVWPNTCDGCVPNTPATWGNSWWFASTARWGVASQGQYCNYQYFSASYCYPLDWDLVGLVDSRGATAGTHYLGAELCQGNNNPTGSGCTAASRLHNAGTDGADIGANVRAVLTAVAGVVAAQ